jgi:HEAT repeat protein
VQELIDALDDEDPRQRAEAAWMLGNIGPEAKAAVSALVQALRDEDWRVRDAAIWTLGNTAAMAEAAALCVYNVLDTNCV